MPNSGQPVYSIGAVSRVLGVPAQTLRTWQERYGVVVPELSARGRLLYSRDQVEFFLTGRTSGCSDSPALR